MLTYKHLAARPLYNWNSIGLSSSTSPLSLLSPSGPVHGALTHSRVQICQLFDGQLYIPWVRLYFAPRPGESHNAAQVVDTLPTAPVEVMRLSAVLRPQRPLPPK